MPKTNVILIWSKPQSRKLALAFHEFLPKFLPNARPWMSEKDIDKGAEWRAELESQLSSATSCIICATRQNVRSPWIYYESGRVKGNADTVFVTAYLVGMDASMLSGWPARRSPAHARHR
jgi:hypothetical protein